MNAKLALIAALAVFGYIAINGFFMLCSPTRWAEAFWTAKGMYQDPQRRGRLTAARERGQVRFAGGAMFILGSYAFATIVSAFL